MLLNVERRKDGSKWTYHVRNPKHNKNKAGEFVCEHALNSLQFLAHTRQNSLVLLRARHVRGRRVGGHKIRVRGINRSEHIQRQSRGRRAIEFRNVVQDLNSFGISPATEQELGRLIKVKHEITQEEDGERHTSQHNDIVAPAHVAGNSAARLSCADGFAAREFGVAAPFGVCGSSVGDGGGDDDANRLPHGEEGHEEAAVLREEF
jgi:hypothetical protein